MKYQICNRCVMDTTDKNIIFDENGICNHCSEALSRKDCSILTGEKGIKKYKETIEMLKKEGKGKKYDCVVGISGGIDSSYLVYLLHKEGIRMLGVHVDAGWNTEISNNNIKILCDCCDIDLKIININKNEMMDLQRAYFLAEVVNQDIPQDHAFFAALYKFTLENGIKYFISGHNWVSESITPATWGYSSEDSINLKDIHKKYGRVKLDTYPIMSFFDVNFRYPYLSKLERITPLDWLEYSPEKALQILHNEIGFQYYGSKHCESVFTRLYQTYIMPEKFGFEKRRAHLSSEIISSLITREEALKVLATPVGDKDQIEKDINYFINKIDISREEFDEIIARKGYRNHTEFRTDSNYYKVKNLLKRMIGK
ncbi:MAG: N-acetyl sugar amidotransferase [Bacilli bacterium]